MTEQASKDGVNGTPTVFVNGKQVDASLSALKAAVAEGRCRGPAPVAVQDAVADSHVVVVRVDVGVTARAPSTSQPVVDGRCRVGVDLAAELARARRRAGPRMDRPFDVVVLTCWRLPSARCRR